MYYYDIVNMNSKYLVFLVCVSIFELHWHGRVGCPLQIDGWITHRWFSVSQANIQSVWRGLQKQMYAEMYALRYLF